MLGPAKLVLEVDPLVPPSHLRVRWVSITASFKTRKCLACAVVATFSSALGEENPMERICHCAVIVIADRAEARINERIRSREVLLVGPEGEKMGVRPTPEALRMAGDLGLDLVEVAAKANPPVARIMDYGKYKYEQSQREKESRKKSTNITVKEMKYRPKIGIGDFDTKTKKVEKFLGEGAKVKVTIMFRGREMQHPELGRRILDDVADRVEHLANVEFGPNLEGRNMVMVLGPDKKKLAVLKKKQDEAAAAEAVLAETDASENAPESSEEE